MSSLVPGAGYPPTATSARPAPNRPRPRYTLPGPGRAGDRYPVPGYACRS